MNRPTTYMLTAALLSLTLLPNSGFGQQRSLKDQLVGTWTIVSNDQTLPNGTKVQPFGANPKGLTVLDANGRFYQMLVRPDLPKLASNNRLAPTPEEAKAIAVGTIFILGTYTVDEAKKILNIRTEASTFANLDGNELNWTITSITSDELNLV